MLGVYMSVCMYACIYIYIYIYIYALTKRRREANIISGTNIKQLSNQYASHTVSCVVIIPTSLLLQIYRDTE